MSKPLELLEKTYGAQTVGGQIIVLIDGVHTVIGHMNLDQVVLTEAGQELLRVAPLDHDGSGARGGSRKRRTRADEPTTDEPAADEPEVTEPTAEGE